MTKTEITNYIDGILQNTKYKCTSKELEDRYKIEITGQIYTYSRSSVSIDIIQSDNLFNAYTRGSTMIMDIGKKDGSSYGYSYDSTDVLILTNKITSKIRQQKKLGVIKNKAYLEIPEFIEKSFGVDRKLITEEEIEFTPYCRFEVAGVAFSYYGTITDASFIVTDGGYKSYSTFRRELEEIHHHFSDRQKGLLTP